MAQKILFLLFIFFTASAGFSQNTRTKISGTVTDIENKPIPGANLVLEGTIDGATADEQGRFEFETKKTGQFTLLITAIDFNRKTVQVDIKAGTPIELTIQLSQEVETEEIVVTASSFTSGSNSQVTLTPLEIVRIPGADADLYRAITTFPGSNQVNEGSKITVRGGDPNEVLTILDQASLLNPFIFDDDFNTSSYSTVNPWSLRGINFSSGGFSAQFGNALSAVLDLKSYELPQSTGIFALLGIGYGGLSGTYLSNDGKVGATFSGGHTYLKPFLDLNGRKTDYSPIPTARSLGGTFSYKMNPTSVLKIYGNYSGDKVGILSNTPSYDGYFNSKSSSYFTNLKYSTAPTDVSLLSISASFSSYDKDNNFGILDNTVKEIYAKLRADFSTPISNTLDFSTGAEYEYDSYETSGIFPQNSYNIRPGAPSVMLDTTTNSGRIGAYGELRYRVTDNLYTIGGLRSDYHTLSKNISFDPRLSLVYRLSDKHFLKGATGIYHQYTELGNYVQGFNDSLDAEEAIHYILGYEFNDDGDWIFRVESYYKDYKDLIARNLTSGYYGNSGKGFAKGIDVFFKSKISNKYTGWISYAYSDSKRRQYNATAETSADYDITHSLTIVSSYNIFDDLTLGATYRISTGKPYTPVLSSTFNPVNNVYVPVYAERNSSRFPTYKRIDMNLQHIFSLFGKFAVAFAAFNNVLNEKNLFTYTYNFDYSEQIGIVSTNERSVFFGLGLQL